VLSKSEYKRLRVQVPEEFQLAIVISVLDALLARCTERERYVTREMLELYKAEPERLDGEPN